MNKFWQKLGISILIFVIFSAEFTVLANDPVWLKQLKQVKPLETTRQDIEKLFGKEENEVSGSWYLLNEYNTKYGE